jgi:hypothetical protein
MTDEQPVALKKRKTTPSSDCVLTCVIHYESNKQEKEVKPLTLVSFQTIKKSASVRQSAETENQRLDAICANIPDELDVSQHGSHRWCYNNFTNVSKIVKKLEAPQTNSEPLPSASEGKSRKSDRNISNKITTLTLLPQNECLFCSKGRKKGKLGEEGLTKCVSKNAELTIKQCAAEKQDFRLLGKVTDVDLIAKEARYHESCRKAYVRSEERQHHQVSVTLQTDDVIYGGAEQRAAYDEAFQYICQHVTTSIIKGGCVERMTMLRERYLNYILEKTPQYYNENHKTDKLKEKLIAFFGDKINFWRPNNRSDLVYSSNISTGEAVQVAFEAATSESKVLEEAALILRRNIQQAFRNSKEMPWPPTAEYLKSEGPSPPTSVSDFFSVLLSGKKSASASTTIERLVSSFAQDVCSAATQSKWKMPKHITLATTLRTLGVGAKVQTILNRYGHCVSYSQSLEFETALANQVCSAETVIPTNISTSLNVVSHLCWDNFDINEETPSGAGTTHTTHGIVVQEVKQSSNELNDSDSSTVKKSKQRSFRFVPPTLPACYSQKRVEPSFSQQHQNTSTFSGPHTLSVQSAVKSLWIFSRVYVNQCLSIPQWSGWISKICDDGTPTTQSNIGYMAPILHPITDYATVQKCLMTSMEVSKSLNQKYTFVTMDLAAAKIAYDIIWDNTDKFSTIVLNLGPFHTMCSYMGALGKMMVGSGFEEVLLQSTLCASGSIDQVVSGKHYNRAIRVHQRMMEAIERMLLDIFSTSCESVNFSDFADNMASSSEFPNAETFAQTLSDESFLLLAEEYENFKNKVRQGSLGKTAQFWMSYCDCVWTLLTFQMAVKTNDLLAYIATLRDMCGLLFSSNHLNYAKYLPVYYMSLLDLESSHPGASKLLQENGFTAARSSIPGCRNAIDLTIEQTINRSAKTAGGIIGFSRNKAAYYRWCVTRHRRATYVDLTLDELDMQDSCEDGHKSTRISQIKQSEAEVLSVISAFKQFVNPFAMQDDSKDRLYCISSGLPSDAKIENDLLCYTTKGNDVAKEFIQSRLINKTVKFQDPVKKSKLLTFASMAVKKTLTSSQKKAIEIKAERNLIGNLLVLSQKNNISLEKLFSYSLSPIPWSLATADGSFVKTDKAQLMHMLQDNVPSKTSNNPDASEACSYILDGNAMIQATVLLPDTFGEFALKMFHSLPKAPLIHFVTDTYRQNSIKEQERQRRSAGVSVVEYESITSQTKMPRDFKCFLHSSRSKTQLIHFILNEWKTPQYAKLFQQRRILFASDLSCVSLQSQDGMSVTMVEEPLYATNQEEADTRLILHAVLASQEVAEGVKLVVRSPDTDVLILLISHCHRIKRETLFETGTGNNRRILNVNHIAHTVGPDLAEALPAFHAFTGCDTTSSFVRKGKRGPYKLLSTNENFISLFKDFGSTMNWMNSANWNKLQQFVCSMYVRPNYNDTNVLRYDLFKTRYEPKSSKSVLRFKNGIDMSLLPPCQSSLLMHTKRATLQAFIWRHAHVADVSMPSPVGNGWKESEDKTLEVEWTDGDVMPRQLVDILVCDQLSNGSATEEHQSVSEDMIEEDELDNILDIVFDDEEAE